MSYAMFQKYVKFLGADTDELAAKANINLKRMPGFFSPNDLAAIKAAKSATPADRFLAMDDKSAAASEALKMKALVDANDISKDAAAGAVADADADAPVGRRRIRLDQTADVNQTAESMPDITGRAECISLDPGLLS